VPRVTVTPSVSELLRTVTPPPPVAEKAKLVTDLDSRYRLITNAILRGDCRPHASELVRRYHLSYRTARELLTELVAKGYLIQNGTEYSLNLIEPNICRTHQVCGGIAYQSPADLIKVFFPNPRAALPVRLRSGEVEWVTWGRRQHEEGNMPNGGWARLDSVKSGRWQRYQPRPVLIPASSYMEKDASGGSHWFPLADTFFIQGLLADHSSEQRLYVVTVSPPAEYAHIHHRWPRLIQQEVNAEPRVFN